jgi:hypothetical protein
MDVLLPNSTSEIMAWSPFFQTRAREKADTPHEKYFTNLGQKKLLPTPRSYPSYSL